MGFLSVVCPCIFLQYRRFSSQFNSHRYLLPSACNPSGKPFVMLLWNFSRFCSTFWLIPSSHDCAQHQEANHDSNNYTLAKFRFRIKHDDHFQKPFKLFYPSSLECCCVSVFLKDEQAYVFPRGAEFQLSVNGLGDYGVTQPYWLAVRAKGGHDVFRC